MMAALPRRKVIGLKKDQERRNKDVILKKLM